MRKPKHWMVVAMAAAIAFVLGASTAVIALAPTPVTGTGTDVTRVKTISQSAEFMTSSTSAVDVPDASRTINVSGSALLVARFQADAFCAGSDAGKCWVRMVIDNGATETEIFPGVSVFLNAPSVFLTEQTRSIERSVTVGPGTYVIQVQAFVEDADDAIHLLRYHLTLERIV